MSSCDVTWAEDYKFENEKKSGGVELERSELTRPVARSSSLLEARGSKIH